MYPILVNSVFDVDITKIGFLLLVPYVTIFKVSLVGTSHGDKRDKLPWGFASRSRLSFWSILFFCNFVSNKNVKKINAREVLTIT